jgi:hypothetical protein
MLAKVFLQTIVLVLSPALAAGASVGKFLAFLLFDSGLFYMRLYDLSSNFAV